MIRTRRLLGSLLLLLFGLGLWFAVSPSPVFADRIVLTDGRVLEGVIVEENEDFIIVDTGRSKKTIELHRIALIEKSADIFSEYEQSLEDLRSHDVDGAYELGLWCMNKGLYPQAIDLFHRVIRLDKGHREAHEQLGYRRYNGEWLTEEEYLLREGYVRYEGEWIPGEDQKKYEQGLVQLDDGVWVPKDQLAAEDKERIRRPRAPKENPGAPTVASKLEERRAVPKENDPQQPAMSPEERAAALEQEKRSGGWQVGHSTKYYDILSNGDAREVQRLGQIMDLMFESYKKIFAYEQELTRPFPILIYGSQNEFMAQTGMGPGVGGFYDGEKIVAFHGSLGSLSTQEVLFHEGTHQFQGLVFGRAMWSARIWFIEGLAVYFEASEVEGRKLRTSVIPQARLSTLKNAMRSGEYVGLAELLRMEQSQFGAFHYAHAWGLIYFLIHGTKGGKERFIEYYERVRDGTYEGTKTFEELFNRPIPEIEEAWKDYITRLSP